MPDSNETYRVYAIKYARHQRMSSANFIGGDSHDVPMPLDYFVWAVVGKSRTFGLADSPHLVIPGHDPEVLKRCPATSREHDGWIAQLDGGPR